jgi:polysaccharide biosynthesis/export protein
VESDGGATFPHAGHINVTGKTLAQTRAIVTARLSKYYRNPQFDLQVQEFHGQKITVSGAVVKPGVQTLNHESLTIKRALEMAGGPTQAGDIANAVIIHRDGSRETANLLDLFYQGDTTQDRTLFPEDTLLIPESHRNKVFMMGEVSKPSAYYITAGHLSLTEGLNEAGGLNSLTASERRIYVIRNAISPDVMDAYESGAPSDDALVENAADNATIYQLDASNPAAFALADQFALQPRDIVYVSVAGITQWHRFISQLIPSAISYSPQINR